MNTDKFLIIDGNSIGMRAATAKPPFQDELTNSKGVITGTTFRFFNILNKTLSMIKPTHVLIAFDTSGFTFRHNIDSEYKANRENSPMKEQVYNQFPDIKKILDAVGIKHDNVLSYEGDDIVGTYANISKASETYILSGDKDIFQLINKNTRVIFPIKGVSEVGIYDENSFKEKFSINVNQYTDYKCLIGDGGDNIKGLDGCGEKTAVKILNQYGSINELLLHLDEENKSIRGWKNISSKLKNWNYEKTNQLVKINIHSPINYSYEECEIHLNWRNAISIFEELEFNSFVKKAKGDGFYGKTW